MARCPVKRCATLLAEGAVLCVPHFVALPAALQLAINDALPFGRKDLRLEVAIGNAIRHLNAQSGDERQTPLL